MTASLLLVAEHGLSAFLSALQSIFYSVLRQMLRCKFNNVLLLNNHPMLLTAFKKKKKDLNKEESHLS